MLARDIEGNVLFLKSCREKFTGLSRSLGAGFSEDLAHLWEFLSSKYRREKPVV